MKEAKIKDDMEVPEGRQQILIGLGICLFFIAVCVLVSVAGIRSRRFMDVAVSESVSEGRAALEVWQQHNVRGRTLLLFDSKLHADSSRDSAVTNDNYVDAAITRNFVRRVIHVVPDQRWQEASQYLMASGLAAYSKGRLLTTIDGAPLEVTTLGNLPEIREKALVHINWDFFDSSPSSPVSQLLSSSSIDLDIVTMTGTNQSKHLTDKGQTNTGVPETIRGRLYRTPSPQSPPLTKVGALIKGGEVRTPAE